MASIRQIPTEDVEQIPPATEILLDELRIANSAQAESLARAIFDQRGMRICQRTLDLREDPNVRGEHDPTDPLDDRFMVFRSFGDGTDPERVQDYPWPPPLHHRVVLEGDEDTIRLRFRPGLWRPAREDEPLPPFTLGMLVSQSPTEIPFWWDYDVNAVTHEAELRFESTPVDAEGWAEVVASGLTPGGEYALALVSLSPLSGDIFVIEEMTWSLEGADGGETGDTGGDETGETGSGEGGGSASGEESGDAGSGDTMGTEGTEGIESGGRPDPGDDPGAGEAGSAGGCACSATSSADTSLASSLAPLALFVVFGRRRRRRRAQL